MSPPDPRDAPIEALREGLTRLGRLARERVDARVAAATHDSTVASDDRPDAAPPPASAPSTPPDELRASLVELAVRCPTSAVTTRVAGVTGELLAWAEREREAPESALHAALVAEVVSDEVRFLRRLVLVARSGNPIDEDGPASNVVEVGDDVPPPAPRADAFSELARELRSTRAGIQAIVQGRSGGVAARPDDRADARALEDEATRLRAEAARRRADHLLEEAEPVFAEPWRASGRVVAHARRLTRLLLTATEVEVELALVDATEDGPRHERIRDVRARTRAALQELFDHGDDDERLRASVLVAASGLEEMADRALAAPDARSSAAAVATMRAAADDIHWLRAAARRRRRRLGLSLAPWRRLLPRTPVQAALVVLGRRRFRLLAEAQDRELATRTHGLVGSRGARFIDRTVNALIILVVALLVVEWVFLGETPEAEASEDVLTRRFRLLLTAIDAVVCGVFLLELFFRLALVSGKTRYFLRHVVIDFIPSVPWGLALELARVPLRGADALRILRALRLLRGVARLGRVVMLALRAVDAAVRRHASALDRDVVFFEPDRDGARGGGPSLGDRLAEAGGDLGRHAAALERRLPPPARLRFLQARLGLFAARLAEPSETPEERAASAPSLFAGPVDAAGVVHLAPGEPVRAEELSTVLVDVDAAWVERHLGQDGALRLARVARMADRPLVRRLAIFRALSEPIADPFESAARVLRAGGRLLESIVRAVRWVADLHGVFTGPQLVDRTGMLLIKATANPAKRLLGFGALFVLLSVLAMRIDAIEPLARWCSRALGPAILVLGGTCLVLLVLGHWLRRIAGEASDFYARVAEAHFQNLLLFVKKRRPSEDRAMLDRRVLERERALGMERWGRDARRRVDLFYHDYLDGAPFYRDDTKTANQLLGNLALESIRRERLGQGRREVRKIEKLDLDRERILTVGPSLWFRQITETLTQRSARLVVDYARHAIPTAELPHRGAEAAESFERWLQYREAAVDCAERGLPPTPPAPGDDAAETPALLAQDQWFSTAEFSVLNFLFPSADFDERVRERFGDRLLRLLQADRRAIIREIFGSYPLHLVPRSTRSVNLYRLYREALGGGQALLLPFRAAIWTFRVTRWAIVRLVLTVREVLSPTLAPGPRGRGWAGFDVAVRKIHRMRRPIALQAMMLRASFDPEYLGFALPGLTPPPAARDDGSLGNDCWADLDGLNAPQHDRDRFEELARELEAAMGELAAFCRDRAELVERLSPAARRALAIAFAIDYRGLRRLASAEERVAAAVAAAREPEGSTVAPEPGSLVPAGEDEEPERLGLLGRLRWMFGREDAAFATFCETRSGDLVAGSPARRALFRAYLVDRGGLAALVRLGLERDVSDGYEAAVSRLIDRVEHEAIVFSEQLVALRTVQTLTLLDIRNAVDLVRGLGFSKG